MRMLELRYRSITTVHYGSLHAEIKFDGRVVLGLARVERWLRNALL